MKTFLLILLFSLTTQVKQYQIYEAEELGTRYLQRGQMAITEKVIYLKLDTAVFVFPVKFTDGNGSYLVGYDSIFNGVIKVYNSRKNEDNQREEGNILVECWSSRRYRKVIYKYR